MNKLRILCNVILRAWFVHHRHYLEQTKTFVLGFVFVFFLAHEQAIEGKLFAKESWHAAYWSNLELTLEVEVAMEWKTGVVVATVIWRTVFRKTRHSFSSLRVFLPAGGLSAACSRTWLTPILRCLKSLWVTFRLMPVTPWTRRRRCSGSPRHNILPYRHPPSIPKAGMLILKNFSHTASFSPFTKREWQKLKLLLNVTLFFHHSKSFLYLGNFNECFECLYWAYLLYAIPRLLPRSSSFSPLHSKSISKLPSSPATVFLFSDPSL